MAARIVRLMPGYARSLARLGIRAGTSAGRKVAATIRALARAPNLPAPQDVETLIPPVRVVFARRVPGHALWLWYSATDAVLTVYTLTGGIP